MSVLCMCVCYVYVSVRETNALLVDGGLPLHWRSCTPRRWRSSSQLLPPPLSIMCMWVGGSGVGSLKGVVLALLQVGGSGVGSCTPGLGDLV